MLSKTALSILERLEVGTINIKDVKWNEVRSFRKLEADGVIAQGTYGTDPELPEDYAKGERVEWYMTSFGHSLRSIARQAQPATADLLVAEIETPVEVVLSDVPHTFTRWQEVECLKAFPRKGEAGVWLKGRYMGVFPGDKRYAAVRINGINEAARVGEIRPLGAALFIADSRAARNQVVQAWLEGKDMTPVTLLEQGSVLFNDEPITTDIDGKIITLGVQPTPQDDHIHKGTMAEFFEGIKSAERHPEPLPHDQPALPTDDDVRAVMQREYPTIASEDGLGQHRNAGMLNAVLGTRRS